MIIYLLYRACKHLWLKHAKTLSGWLLQYPKCWNRGSNELLSSISSIPPKYLGPLGRWQEGRDLQAQLDETSKEAALLQERLRMEEQRHRSELEAAEAGCHAWPQPADVAGVGNGRWRCVEWNGMWFPSIPCWSGKNADEGEKDEKVWLG